MGSHQSIRKRIHKAGAEPELIRYETNIDQSLSCGQPSVTPPRGKMDLRSTPDWVLTECREIVRKTFAFLSAKELNTCARVCRRWKTLARLELGRRWSLEWVSDFREDSPVHQTENPLGAFGAKLQSNLNAMASQPKFVLTFTEHSKGSDYRGRTSAGPRKSTEVITYIKSLLPDDCVYLSLLTPGTVAPSSSESTVPAAESESQGGALCAMFPSMPGVDIRIIAIPHNLLEGDDGGVHWQRWLAAGISPQDTQCVLLFGWGYSSLVQQAANQLQRLFHEKTRRCPVIAGAIVNRLLSRGLLEKSEESSGVIGVTFSGPNVRAASVLLGEKTRKREDARNAILRLREANLCVRPKQSIGFMFACAGRGYYFYDDGNVESEEFHRVFPSVPLIGLFGGGEIGSLNLTVGRETELAMPSRIDRAYTTIMCLLTFDPS